MVQQYSQHVGIQICLVSSATVMSLWSMEHIVDILESVYNEY